MSDCPTMPIWRLRIRQWRRLFSIGCNNTVFRAWTGPLRNGPSYRRIDGTLFAFGGIRTSTGTDLLDNKRYWLLGETHLYLVTSNQALLSMNQGLLSTATILERFAEAFTSY